MRRFFLMIIGFSLLVWGAFSRDATKGIVTDSDTNLEWQDSYASGSVDSNETWEDHTMTPQEGAIGYCENLTLNGKTDWRLPNINELNSIVDDTRTPAIYSIFQETNTSLPYWSATTRKVNKTRAWVLEFNYGTNSTEGISKDGTGVAHFIRCVRDK